jgi:hypothetical protein
MIKATIPICVDILLLVLLRAPISKMVYPLIFVKALIVLHRIVIVIVVLSFEGREMSLYFCNSVECIRNFPRVVRFT